ncbi:unnamed protein product [Spodoptera exigua]|nr:unnamed protein product [Spodoptera exigua]
MYVVKESEITDAMYVIHTGKVRETSEEAMDISARVYPAGSYFGVGLFQNTPYTHSYETLTKSQVLTLKLDDWEYLLNLFPESKKSIHKHLRQLRDDQTGNSNWPGGPSTDTPPEYVMAVMRQETSDLSEFPSVQTHFGRESVTDIKETASSHLLSENRHSRYFALPSDNKAPDTMSISRDIEEDNQSLAPSGSQLSKEPRTNLKSVFKKIANTAKKLMGRVSDVELTAAGDELLLEEDAEATEALLKQFEKARKQANYNFKRQKPRRHALIFHAPEEMTEKYLETVDMESFDNLDHRKSKHLQEKPLSNIEKRSRNVFRLGHKQKSKFDESISESELTIDLEGALAENEAREKVLETRSQTKQETVRKQVTQNTSVVGEATTSKEVIEGKMSPTGQNPNDTLPARKFNVPTPLKQKLDQESTQPDQEKDILVMQHKTKLVEPKADILPPVILKATEGSPLGFAREEQMPGTSKDISKSETNATPTFISLKEASKSDESLLEPSKKSREILLPDLSASHVTYTRWQEEKTSNVIALAQNENIQHKSQTLIDQNDSKKEAETSRGPVPQSSRYTGATGFAPIETEPGTSKPYIPIIFSYPHPKTDQDTQSSGQDSQQDKGTINIADERKPSKTLVLSDSKADTLESVIPSAKPDGGVIFQISRSMSEDKSTKIVDIIKPSSQTVYEGTSTPALPTEIENRTEEPFVEQKDSFVNAEIVYDPHQTNYDDDYDGIPAKATTSAAPSLNNEESINTKNNRLLIHVRYDEKEEITNDSDESDDVKPSKKNKTPEDNELGSDDDAGTSNLKSESPDKKSRK